ncbi:MAG: PG0541 family transporter-associated protein [Candidatus Omnitrophota bacterium]
MLKMVMIAYNEAIDMEVMEAMEICNLKNYTKVMGVFGRGEGSGTHLGNDIWPGRNNLLYVAAPENSAKQLLSAVKELKQKLDKEGIKAFTWSLDEL